MAFDVSQLASSGTLPPEVEEQAIKEVPVDDELARYAYMLGVELLEDGNGMATLQKAVQQSSDPILVISQFIVQMVAQLTDVLSQETNFDPRVMLVKGGFVDSISDYIVEKLNLGEEADAMIEQEVMEMIKGLAKGESAPSNQGPGPQGQQGPGGPPSQQGPAPAQQGVAPSGIESVAMGGGF